MIISGLTDVKHDIEIPNIDDFSLLRAWKKSKRRVSSAIN